MATSSMSVGVLASLLLSVLLTAARVALADAFAVELFVETDYVTATVVSFFGVSVDALTLSSAT